MCLIYPFKSQHDSIYDMIDMSDLVKLLSRHFNMIDISDLVKLLSRHFKAKL
jgi:hypothetical protein